MSIVNTLRKSHGLTVDDFASKLGISVSLARALMYGQRNPSIKVLKAIKREFPEVNLEDFIGYDD